MWVRVNRGGEGRGGVISEWLSHPTRPIEFPAFLCHTPVRFESNSLVLVDLFGRRNTENLVEAETQCACAIYELLLSATERWILG